MINIENLADALANHIAKCRSAQIVCKAPVAVESWFRIELVSGLVDAGVAFEHVQFAYTCPGCHDKGDLAITTPEFLPVCELKSFVLFRGCEQDQYISRPTEQTRQPSR